MAKEVKPGLPPQGAKALIKSWGDANEAMLRQGKRKKQATKGKKK